MKKFLCLGLLCFGQLSFVSAMNYPTALTKLGIDDKRFVAGTALTIVGASVAVVAPRIENQNVAVPLTGLGLATTIYGLCKMASIRNTKYSQFDVPAKKQNDSVGVAAQ